LLTLTRKILLYYGINSKSFNALSHLEKPITKNKDFCKLKVEFLRPYCVVFLEQVILNEKNIDFKICSKYKTTNQYLKQIHFNYLYQDSEFSNTEFPESDMIKLIKFTNNESNLDEKVSGWIEYNITKYINNDSYLTKKIIENFWEITNNGLVHGNNENGVSIAGQFYPLKKYFEIAFYDRGIGIPAMVRENINTLTDKNDDECIDNTYGYSTSIIRNNIKGTLVNVRINYN